MALVCVQLKEIGVSRYKILCKENLRRTNKVTSHFISVNALPMVMELSNLVNWVNCEVAPEKQES